MAKVRKNPARFDHENHEIVLYKWFAEKSKNPRNPEFKMLISYTTSFPTYKIVIRDDIEVNSTQDRVNELGDASVPFKFDVHSFIFSEDAVDLEKKLHTILNEKRVNKVNLRKEFFRISLDELEKLVLNVDPTAEFNRTMAAEEFRQSQSTNEVYTTDFKPEEDSV